MESHRDKIDDETEQKEIGEISPQLDIVIPATSTDTCAPVNEQSQSDVRTTQDTKKFDVSEQRMESKVRSSCGTSVITDEVQEAEGKDLVTQESSRKKFKKAQEEEKESSLQDILCPFKSTDVAESELGSATSTSTDAWFENVPGSGLPGDRTPSDSVTSSTKIASTSSCRSSHPIAIPSTSRDSPGVKPERNSPKRPNNFGTQIKQSIHVFYPRNSTSILKKLPIPYRRGQHIHLRNSPESSDYGGSPDSLDDPLLMQALDSPENKETEDLDAFANSESTICIQTHLNLEDEKSSISDHLFQSTICIQTHLNLEDEKSSISDPIEEILDDQQHDPIEEILDDQQHDPIEEKLDNLSSGSGHAEVSSEELSNTNP